MLRGHRPLPGDEDAWRIPGEVADREANAGSLPDSPSDSRDSLLNLEVYSNMIDNDATVRTVDCEVDTTAFDEWFRLIDLDMRFTRVLRILESEDGGLSEA